MLCCFFLCLIIPLVAPFQTMISMCIILIAMFCGVNLLLLSEYSDLILYSLDNNTSLTYYVHVSSGLIMSERVAWHSRVYGDRYIPYRGAMNMAMAQGLLTIPTKETRTSEIVTPAKEAYRKLLADTLLGNSRILSFPKEPSGDINSTPALPCLSEVQPVKKIRRICQEPEDGFNLPNMLCYRQLNLFDWGSNNIFAVAIENSVHLLRDGSDEFTKELLKVADTSGPVTSVSWSPDCRRIAVGLNNSSVAVYDATTCILTRVFHGIHKYLVGSLAWNDCILTTGGADGNIINNDVRIKSHVVSRYEGHTSPVCGLKWSSSGSYLASGGFDKLLQIWDVSKSSRLHRFNNHTANVRALAWCPYESNILASGGGQSDHSIKFWNVSTGTCLNSIDTGSEVCSLLFNKNGRELLSSHGGAKNQLALWRYPSMVQMAEIIGHTAPVLYLALGPDGCKVASASEDETMKLWEVFEKRTEKTCKTMITHSFGPSNMNIR